MSVMVTYPHANTVSHNFSWSLLRLVMAEKDRIFDVRGVRAYAGDGLIAARNLAVEMFLESDAEWLWTLDTDIGFPPYTLDNLLSHGEDYSVVSGLYNTILEQGSDGNGAPEYWTKLPLVMHKSDTGTYRRYLSYEGFMEVDVVGAGCLLVNRGVFEKIGGNWYNCLPGYGEDFSFCMRVQEAGYKILCDTTIPLSHHKAVWV